MIKDCDVVVIGAGAAGLAAATQLAGSGLAICMLEARDRIGGRMYTLRDDALRAPIEMGAEFIHGKPPEIWDLLKNAKVPVTEMEGDSWCSKGEEVGPCNFFGMVDKILKKMDDHSPDESFCDFLDRCWANPEKDSKVEEAKQRAIGYVSGFNAADPKLVGAHWLVAEMRAEEKIEGDRAFHSKNGYQDLVSIFQGLIEKADIPVYNSTVVRSVHWKSRSAEVRGRNSDGEFVLHAKSVLVTIPLPLLQAPAGELGAIDFVPPLPTEKLAAMRKLEMGQVVRVVLKFRQRFWEQIIPPSGKGKSLGEMSFLFTEDNVFPTWWTTMPRRLPMITGWAPFRGAQKLSGRTEAFVCDQAVRALAQALQLDAAELEKQLEGAYFHDWQSDPFSRGAYSYGKVGANGAHETLGAPLADTVFFAGEATDTSGHNGTVHGAIASGYRAASEILSAALQAVNR
jgi:monoamine oxidase